MRAATFVLLFLGARTIDQKESRVYRTQRTNWKQRGLRRNSVDIPPISVPDPDPPVFGPPGSGSGSFYHHAKIIRKTLILTIL